MRVLPAAAARRDGARVLGPALALFGIMLAGPHASAEAPAETPREVITRKQQEVLATRTFLNAHPDMKYRQEGWVAYQAGDHAKAMAHFRKASLYADKASQAMVAEMLWKGIGVPADAPMAYAWADMAAERGYPQFIRLREQYWRQLDPSQRERAVQQGQVLLAEYSDDVARPRMARFMKKAKQRAFRTSHSVSQAKEVRVPNQSGTGMVYIPGSRFYDAKFWDPVQYQAWQDAQWKQLPQGKVDVGELEQVERKP